MDIDLGIEIDKGFLYVLRRAKASRTKETAYTETQSPKKAANRPGSWELCWERKVMDEKWSYFVTQ